MTQPPDGKRTCVFCGEAGITREHVWPYWLCREICRRYKGIKFEATHDGKKRVSNVVDAVVKRVCKTCNEGWMGRIEEAAKPILLPMIFGEKPLLALSPADQTIVATWALKTALMSDFFSRTSAYPLSVHRRLFDMRRPGANCRVMIAAYGGRDLKLATYSSPIKVTTQEHFNSVGVIQRSPVAMTGGTSTARLLHLILQVIVFERDDLPVPIARNPVAFDRVIWPPDTIAVDWPPSGESLDESAVLAYAERSGNFGRPNRNSDRPA
jgi:hypothetical protein